MTELTGQRHFLSVTYFILCWIPRHMISIPSVPRYDYHKSASRSSSHPRHQILQSREDVECPCRLVIPSPAMSCTVKLEERTSCKEHDIVPNNNWMHQAEAMTEYASATHTYGRMSDLNYNGSTSLQPFCKIQASGCTMLTDTC
jgi:hypothetical protein